MLLVKTFGPNSWVKCHKCSQYFYIAIEPFNQSQK